MEKKFLTAIICGALIFGFNVSEIQAADSSNSREKISSQNKYTPPPSRYAPPQVPDYGLPQPAYTPPPPDLKQKT